MVEAKNILEQQDVDTLRSSPEALLEQPEGGVAGDLDLSVEDQLALSQASRVHAETERQRVAKGIVDATRNACQELIADGEKVLKKAHRLEVEAERKHQAAGAMMEKANTARVEAEAYSKKVKAEADAFRADADSHAERVVAEAQQQAQEILEHARAAVQRECAELKQQAAFEAKQMLGQAKVIRTATQEELEAHRIYVEAARLNAESQEVLVRARMKLEEPAQDHSEKWLPILESAQRWQGVGEVEAYKVIADELGAMSRIASKATKPTAKPQAPKLTAKPQAGSNGKKPARQAKSRAA